MRIYYAIKVVEAHEFVVGVLYYADKFVLSFAYPA